MTDSTPPETMEYGQLTVETLDEVVPRLKNFTEELINRLKICEIKVETAPIYLLNSSSHPLEVPCSGNGIPIQMNFTATLPIWAPEPRARLEVRFNHGRRYFYSEKEKRRYFYSEKENQFRNTKFPMAKILKRFLTEIKIHERKLRIKSEKEQKAAQAIQAFETLAKKLGIPPSPKYPDVLHKHNVKIICLPKTPTQVTVMLTVPHAQVTEIVGKYLKNKP
jgi:hypothetical protein